MNNPTNSLSCVHNPDRKPEPLTPEKLIALPGCGHYSLPQAEQILETIRKLSRLLLETNRQFQNNTIDNQQVVYLNQGTGEQNHVPLINHHSPENKAA